MNTHVRIAPYYSADRAAWVPCVVVEDPATGELRGVVGQQDFGTYPEALEASRYLALDLAR